MMLSNSQDSTINDVHLYSKSIRNSWIYKSWDKHTSQILNI